MSAEFPVYDDVLHSTFMAVVGALQESTRAEQVGFFLRDFLITQLIGFDLISKWTVVNPMGLLEEELTKRNIPLPEPQLVSYKKLHAQCPDETITAAEEEAASVSLQRNYGYTENRKAFDFPTTRATSAAVSKLSQQQLMK